MGLRSSWTQHWPPKVCQNQPSLKFGEVGQLAEKLSVSYSRGLTSISYHIHCFFLGAIAVCSTKKANKRKGHIVKYSDDINSLATNQDLATSLWFVTPGRRNASLKASPSQFWLIGSHLSVLDLLTSSCTFWLSVHVR